MVEKTKPQPIEIVEPEKPKPVKPETAAKMVLDGQKTESIHVPVDRVGKSKFVTITVNGVRLKLERGQDHTVPASFAEAWKNSARE